MSRVLSTSHGGMMGMMGGGMMEKRDGRAMEGRELVVIGHGAQRDRQSIFALDLGIQSAFLRGSSAGFT
jgi:hypothetical protein